MMADAANKDPISDLREELYTSRNDCIIQMQPRRRRVGGESMCSGCQSVCAPCQLRVSASLSTRHGPSAG